MSDDRISETPSSSPCPICAAGFAATPGKRCPACGRVPKPPPPPLEDEVRLRELASGFGSCLGFVARLAFTTIASLIACFAVCTSTPGSGLLGGPGGERNGAIAFVVAFVAITSIFLFLHYRNAPANRNEED